MVFLALKFILQWSFPFPLFCIFRFVPQSIFKTQILIMSSATCLCTSSPAKITLGSPASWKWILQRNKYAADTFANCSSSFPLFSMSWWIPGCSLASAPPGTQLEPYLVKMLAGLHALVSHHSGNLRKMLNTCYSSAAQETVAKGNFFSLTIIVLPVSCEKESGHDLSIPFLTPACSSGHPLNTVISCPC